MVGAGKSPSWVGSQAAPTREEKKNALKGIFQINVDASHASWGYFHFPSAPSSWWGHHTVSTQPQGAAGHDPSSQILCIHFPADPCSTCLSNFSQQISLAGVNFVHLWVTQGHSWLCFCVCPSVVWGLGMLFLLKHMIFLSWFQSNGPVWQRKKLNNPVFAGFCPSHLLL